MEESFFEMLERTRLVDRIFFWSAIFLPWFVAALAWIYRRQDFVKKQRHRWVLWLLAAPALLVLWRTYNGVTDHFGLSSVRGLLVNVALFFGAALILTGIRILLRVLLEEPIPSPSASITQRMQALQMRSDTQPETRPPVVPPPPPPVPPSSIPGDKPPT